MKQSTRKAIFEFASIVVAVVLAMGLTEWRQDYLNRRLADQSFDNIIEEITENFEELKIDSARLATDRESMKDWIQKTYAGEETGTLLVGFNFSILSSAALEVARVNQSLTHLSNEKNMDLAEIYSLQEFYSQAGTEIFNLMGDFQSNLHKPDSPEFFSIVIAVLLALFLTEARQNYLDKKQAKASFRAIQHEVRDNLELIKLDSVDHLKKLAAVNRWLNTSEAHRDTVKFRLEIVHSLTKATAWEVAKLNQVVHHMDDTLVMAISRVYTMQDFYDRSGSDMYGQMTGIMASRQNGRFSEGAMNAFGYEVLKEIGMVTTLKQVYEEFLKKHPIPASD